MKNFLIGFITFLILNYTLTFIQGVNDDLWKPIFNFRSNYIEGNYFIFPLVLGVCDDNPMVNGHGWKIKNRGDYFGCDKLQRFININRE